MGMGLNMNIFDKTGKNLQDLLDFTKIQFKDAIDHGFNAEWLGPPRGDLSNLYGTKLDYFKMILSILKDMGLKWPIYYDFYRPTDFSQITSAWKDAFLQYGFEPWFNGVDEFCDGSPACFREGRTSSTMLEHIWKSQVIHSIGAKIAASGAKAYADRLLNPNDPIYTNNFPTGTPTEPEDGAMYTVNEPYIFDLGAGRVTKTPNRIEMYYWQPEVEDPWYNRSNVGYKLWDSGLDGIFSGASIYTSSTFYKDFEWVYPNKHRSNTDRYPSKEGVVPTMEWEAFREGINDLRYMETWKYYDDAVAKTNPTLASQSKSVVDAVSKRYRDDYSSIAPAGFRVPMSQYEADRKTIIAEIEKMKTAAGPIYDADLNSDSKIDPTDLGILKTDFLKLTASLANPKSDIDGDGQATVKDAGILMSQWKP